MTGRKCFQLIARDRVLSLGVQTRIMGIINVTSDSFSGDGQLNRCNSLRTALGIAKRMCLDGADIIDVGGQSTRPGATSVSTDDECRRVIPFIEAFVSSGNKSIISVDTSKVLVAKEALKAGAHLVNIVQTNTLSSMFLRLLRDYNAGVVLMHMRGTPQTMQQKAQYKHFIPEICLELNHAVKSALLAGIKRSTIVIDPGIGFAKTAQQNFLLIKELECLHQFGLPILVGPSRKSFIGAVLGVNPSKRLFGTIAAVVASVLKGAHIVRVHDVFQVKQAVQVADAILKGEQ